MLPSWSGVTQRVNALRTQETIRYERVMQASGYVLLLVSAAEDILPPPTMGRRGETAVVLSWNVANPLGLDRAPSVEIDVTVEGFLVNFQIVNWRDRDKDWHKLYNWSVDPSDRYRIISLLRHIPDFLKELKEPPIDGELIIGYGNYSRSRNFGA